MFPVEPINIPNHLEQV